MVFENVFYLNKTKGNSPISDVITNINAEGILPYLEEVSPKVGMIDTGIFIDNKFLPTEQISVDGTPTNSLIQ
ncbi:hypothetical protein [Jeotgalibacillus marinus]|uniref:Uncharacterized protein n=1 Tax=Jeotgalibacillus marinus TaxID=86667 RepID=A0ABV3Q7S2_9BACL